MGVIVKITDGLGNQMFQYAFARFLEEKTNAQVLLDLSHYEDNTHRRFELDKFNTTYKVASQKDIPLLNYQYKKSKILKQLFKENSLTYQLFYAIFEYFIDDIVYKHKVPGYVNDAFIPNISKKKRIKNGYYEGYWASEKYFPGMRDILLKEYTPKTPLDRRNKEVVDKMIGSNSISLHVRRGDYAKKSLIRHPFLFSLEPSYYEKAIETIKKHVKNPTFFVFSDDIERVKSNLLLSDSAHYIDWNCDNDSYKDLWLMSQCKHHITANSTFSWWGARLNQYKDKIVVCPKSRFSNPILPLLGKSFNRTTVELIPSGRIRV